MIQEIVQFTNNLAENFKILGVKPKVGLHILLRIDEENGEYKLDTENIQYEIYSKKFDNKSDFLKQCMFLGKNAWMIDTNKCFDAPSKAIHTCSPYAMGFKREHLKGGEKYEKNNEKGKKQIHERFDNYFNKSIELLKDKDELSIVEAFRSLFRDKENEYYFDHIFSAVEEKITISRNVLIEKVEVLKEEQKESDKDGKEKIKNKLIELSKEIEQVKELSESDYIIFYLDRPLDYYKKAHKKYLGDKLFNTSKFNTTENEDGNIFGTSNFFNGFNGSMPFLMHQTATFNITKRISDEEARVLHEFKEILPRKILPNPLPIFIYKEELQEKIIGIFKRDGFKSTYKEIIKEICGKGKKEDIANYYLLNYQNTAKGIVFKDFDYVAQFEYSLLDENDEPWGVLNLFDTYDAKSKSLKPNLKLCNIFDLEQAVFNQLLSDRYNKMNYFNDLETKNYDGLARTMQMALKYRKAIYDYVYKSKRKSINHHAFYEIIFNGIKDDIKNAKTYRIKEKLNIWFSLNDKFNFNHTNNIETMASKLKGYQQFVDTLIDGTADTDLATVEDFAFAAGQVIYYLQEQSKSDDISYRLLEPYLQQSKCGEFQKRIANDFARYKHGVYLGKFKAVCSFVLSYETDQNMKHLLPQVLAGVFANNQLFGNKKSTSEINS